MSHRTLLSFVGLLIVLLAFTSACNKLNDLEDLKAVNYNAEFAIPLFSTKTSFEDLLENFDDDTFITFGENNLIILNYKGDITARSSSDLFNVISDFDGVPFPVIDTVMALPFAIPNSIDIDHVILKTGTMKWGYQSEHEEPAIVTVTIPNATLNGEVFQHTQNLPGPISVYFSPEFDMTGYKLASDNDSIYVHYQAYRVNSGFSDTLTNFAMLFDNFEASYVEGYLGNDIYEFERDTIEIDFFDNWTRGDVYFEDPKILLTVDNSFGFPVRAKANLMNVITVEDEVLELQSPYIDSINFDYPSLNEVGEFKSTYFAFDKDNSNIADILGANPVAVDYDLDAVPNPDMDTSIRGFMTDSSFFNVQVEVELPIHGTAVDFVARDTFKVDFSEYDNVEDVEFKVIAENGIPLEVSTQIYFADSDGNILDSLFRPEAIILEAAQVGTQAQVTEIAEKTTFATLDADHFDRIRSTTQLFLTSSFSTTNRGMTTVKITSDQEVNIRMGMKLGIKE